MPKPSRRPLPDGRCRWPLADGRCPRPMPEGRCPRPCRAAGRGRCPKAAPLAEADARRPSPKAAGRGRAGLGADSVVCVLSLPVPLWERVVAHCINGLPLEACGLLAGREGQVLEVYPTANAARSARIYTVEPRDLLRADREAEAAGHSLIGVWHSHTHTAAYPSPTDIEQAPDPDWHYVLVSLSDTDPVLRSYRIVAGQAQEERVVTPA